MKKLITLSVFVILLFTYCTTPKNLVEISLDKTNRTYENHRGETHLIGYTTRNRLTQAPYKEWYAKNHDQFEIKTTVLKGLNKKVKGLEIAIYMATWCRDSQREVPRFLKIMDYLDLKEHQLNIVNFYDKTPNYKQSPDQEEKGLNIHRVPTFIFYKKGVEIGRIVEYPLNSMEIDIAQILLGVPSRPNYRAVTAFNNLLNEKGLSYLKENKKMLANRVKYTVRNSAELNTYGYVLLDTENKEAAVTILEINALAFPTVPNVFDSLAEGYLAIEQTDLAIQNYEKVLNLDAKNEQAKKMLEQLKKG